MSQSKIVKILFNTHISQEVLSKKGILPEELFLDVLFRDCCTMGLKLSKEIFIIRHAIFEAKKENNVLYNKEKLTPEYEEKLNKQMKEMWEQLCILRQFMVIFYRIPKLEEGMELINELEDDIEELAKIRLLSSSTMKELVEHLKDEVEEIRKENVSHSF